MAHSTLTIKNDHSIVLLAVCDAKYCFTLVDIDNNICVGVFENSMIGYRISQDLMKMPDKATLQGINKVAPYVLVANDAFPLKQYLMKPYPGDSTRRPERVFN